MLEGEILAAEGKLKEAIKTLNKAVEKEDALRYDEPPDWIVPIRHALGAFLLKAARAKEAEAVYRAVPKNWPNKGWSLDGLAASLMAQGQKKTAEAMQKRFVQTRKHADVKIGSSRQCVPGDRVDSGD